MSDYSYISSNLTVVSEKINDCCHRLGINPENITLIAVSKTFPSKAVRAAFQFGQLDFGENKVQELTGKYEELAEISNAQTTISANHPIRWHLIGHLQTNKVKFIVPFVHLIHSLDSVHLALKIQSESSKIGKIVDCLVQVNTSNEDQKSGIEPDEVESLVKEVSSMKNIKIKGLMTIAKFIDDYSDESRRNIVRNNFKQLKGLFDGLSSKNLQNVDMKYLSMGMTADYDIALEEGSNMLRIGTAIFGIRKKSEIN